MNLTDIEVLLYLHSSTGNEIRVTEMQQRLSHITAKEVYTSLDRLHTRDWVKKQYQSGLPRTLIVTLTDDGKEKAEHLENQLGKYVTDIHQPNNSIKVRKSLKSGISEDIRNIVINALVDERAVPESIHQKLVDSITSGIAHLLK
jgi:DNA-binding MarR family transcriptional regulator